MVKCEYCGKKIDLLSDYTWLDQENKRAIHTSCLELQKLLRERKVDVKKMEVDKKERTKFYEKFKKQNQEKPEKNN
jgi:hypothetical protein